MSSTSIVPEQPARTATRLHGDAWLIGRPSGGDSLAFGQLGASQAGARLTYDIDQAAGVALSARASSPLRGKGREAALGLDWRPGPLPLHLLVEGRIPLDGGAPRPAAQLIIGAATRLPLSLHLDAYGQAGAIHHRGGFADGAAHLVRVIAGNDDLRLDIGAGAWAATQRRVSRVDVGPTIGLTLPARDRSVRLSLDYGIM